MSPQEAWPIVSLTLMAVGFWMGWDLGRKREKIAQLEASIENANRRLAELET